MPHPAAYPATRPIQGVGEALWDHRQESRLRGATPNWRGPPAPVLGPTYTEGWRVADGKRVERSVPNGTRAFQTRARHRCESARPCEVRIEQRDSTPSILQRLNLNTSLALLIEGTSGFFVFS